MSWWSSVMLIAEEYNYHTHRMSGKEDSNCFIVLVIYYCIISYHKFCGVEQHPFVIPQFLWVRSLGTGWLGPPFQGLSQALIQESARAGVSSSAWLGKDPLPSSRGCAQFLGGCWTEGLGSLQAIGQRPPSVPCPVDLSYSIRASEGDSQYRESARKASVTVLYGVSMGVTSHHLCCILLVRNKPQPRPQLKGADYTRVWIPEGVNHVGLLRVCPPHSFHPQINWGPKMGMCPGHNLNELV